MSNAILGLGVFILTYGLNMLYTSVFYHRGFTHRAIRLRKWVRNWVVLTGNWITGIDPKTWACMHRLHHRYSDTKRDPHSPVHRGFFRLLLVQLSSYERTFNGLMRREALYTHCVRDLKFPVNWLNRKGLWFLPHLIHTALALGIGLVSGAWGIAGCFLLGLQSHPIQGWMVNAIGHKFGYRNFKTRDNSKNNLFVAIFVMGEGFQNNHHHDPESPRFSVKPWEFDLGYYLCLLVRAAGLIEFHEPKVSVECTKRIAKAA